MKEAVGKGRIPALVDADEHKGRLELEAARDVLTDPVLFKLFQLQLNRAREMYSVGQEPWCIRENETLLDHLARRQKAPESAVRWRKMREATFNECSVEAEILRYMTMHKSNGYERIQVKSRAYHKWRETAEMTLSCALEGLTETIMPKFSSKDTAARNDRLFNDFMRKWISDKVLKTKMPFIAWDEGSKKGYMCVRGVR
jgi:hypothetical protein